MRLFALLGLVAMSLANPIPVEVENFCRVVSNTTLDRTDKEVFFDALFPVTKALCDAVGVEISRAKLEETLWREVIKRGTSGVKPYDQCLNRQFGHTFRRHCSKWL